MSDVRALTTRPTGNAANVLMATLQNTTPDTLNALRVWYTFGTYSVATLEQPGYRVFYSFDGAANSWVLVPGLSSTEALGTQTAVLNFGTPWAPGATLYVLWVDDNADTASDTGYTIDDFIAEDPTPRPIVITRQPVGTNVVQFRPFTLSVQVTGTEPQYQWFLNDNPIDSTLNSTATNATYSVASATSGVDDGFYYVVVTNLVSTNQSDTVEVVVNTDDVLPTVRQAVGSATFTEVTIQFSEIMDPASMDTANFSMAGNNPTTAFLTNGGTVVLLTFPDAQAPDTDYTVTMSYVSDLAGNQVVEGTTATFHSWVPNLLGGVIFQVYTNLSTTDNAIGQLTNNAKFPYSPDETYILNGLNTREVYLDDSHEGYGGRLWTLFVPLATGKYRFFTYSDDSSQIYLNPAGPDPAGRTLVAYELACCNPFTEPAVGMTRTSEPYDMVAGQGYYIEAQYKEGGGGDYCVVGARLEGDPIPASALTNIMSSAASAPALPKGLVGVPVISAQPVGVTVEQPAVATFSVVAGCTPAGPLLYRWQKSDDAGGTWTDIPGAAGPSYTTGPAIGEYQGAPNDNGDQYPRGHQVAGRRGDERPRDPDSDGGPHRSHRGVGRPDGESGGDSHHLLGVDGLSHRGRSHLVLRSATRIVRASA